MPCDGLQVTGYRLRRRELGMFEDARGVVEFMHSKILALFANPTGPWYTAYIAAMLVRRA